jgi:hypothetical protein
MLNKQNQKDKKRNKYEIKRNNIKIILGNILLRFCFEDCDGDENEDGERKRAREKQPGEEIRKKYQ